MNHIPKHRLSWFQKACGVIPVRQIPYHIVNSIQHVVDEGNWRHTFSSSSNDIVNIEINGQNFPLINGEIELFFQLIILYQYPQNLTAFESTVGNHNLVFQVFVNRFFKKSGEMFVMQPLKSEHLDTPYEIAVFVKNSIDKTKNDNFGDDEDDTLNNQPVSPLQPSQMQPV